jgi:flagellar biosynthesis chaperone FliJ
MKVRACWSALENKAERKIALLREETTRAQALRQSLLSSQAKLDGMYKEYHEKNAALCDTKGMTETMNQRQFMSQLLNLRERVRGDLERSEVHLVKLGAHMVVAETERLKMQTLTENDRLAVEKFVQKREQSRMDEMGVMQFNRAQTP